MESHEQDAGTRKATLREGAPQLASEWHPTKNEGLTPDDVRPSSNKNVWWRCSKGHEWPAIIASRRHQGVGCPFCSGLRADPTTSLRALRPDLAAEWHPDKNSTTPDDVKPFSRSRVWWRCSAGHEWFASVASRSQGTGCRMCSLAERGTLATRYPELAREWNVERNGSVTADSVSAGSSTVYWWRCGFGHEWPAKITNRARGTGCPYCAGRLATLATSLKTLYPALAAEWHTEKNGAELSPETVKPKSNKQVWWRCSRDPTHEWPQEVRARTNGASCPRCPRSPRSAARPSERSAKPSRSKRKATTTAARARLRAEPLRLTHPDLATEWDAERNGALGDEVTRGSHAVVWWRCAKDRTHTWPARIGVRARGSSCPLCAGRALTTSTSLRALHPEIAAEWHPEKNAPLTADDVSPGSQRSAWWQCSEGHEWERRVESRTSGGGCPTCGGRVATVSTSLRARFPALAEEWDAEGNGSWTPDTVLPGSGRRVSWRCRSDPRHTWTATIKNRVYRGSGCPRCGSGWTIDNLRAFVASLKDALRDGVFTPAELYVLFQQRGLDRATGKGRGFIKALATGRFPVAELCKFAEGEPSLVDRFVTEPTLTLETAEAGEARATAHEGAADGDAVDALVDESAAAAEPLPVVNAARVLATVDGAVESSADAEATEFLLASATSKLWKHAFVAPSVAAQEAEDFRGGKYAEEVSRRFLHEYREATSLPIPAGYAFQVDGVRREPNLMQRLVAVRVRDQRRVGNWSGTGAGKTLGAILASRVVSANLTVICCPNSVVEGWAEQIAAAFPGSEVRAKTFSPDWDAARADAADAPSRHRYLVVNYEMFQQPGTSSQLVGAFLERERVDFVVVDEIHYAKQRVVENMSLRRRLVNALLAGATERNPELRVLGMSATPVINNLEEGKRMVELITGLAHDDLETKATVSNCMSLHQRLATLGLRWMPEYGTRCEEKVVEVDCSSLLPAIRELGPRGSIPDLERILTRARIPAILANIAPPTLIYTHLLQGIEGALHDACKAAGWRVGFYTGDDKSGLREFLAGRLDVLIGSSAIGTGVDGLQHVCRTLIVNVLPWTAAEFEQLKGRVYRQGQEGHVTVVMPLTFAEVNGNRWSWCESKRQRLLFKKSIADAAVDGVVPEGHLRTPAQAYEDAIGWLARLEAGQVERVERRRIDAPLPVEQGELDRRTRRYGEFSTMNASWNRAQSGTTHERLRSNPEEWEHYHALFREARRTWSVVPCDEMIRWCRGRRGYVIGDFGCGEALLSKAVSDLHEVHSFDHHTNDPDRVVVCDITRVPLEDGVLDAAIFSLSLMGSNFTDYLREAHRTLKIDGWLHVVEATSRFEDVDPSRASGGAEENLGRFRADLERLGFGNVDARPMERFTHISAIKTERPPSTDVVLRFRGRDETAP